MAEDHAVKLAVLEHRNREHDRRLRKVEDAVMQLGDLATALKALRWILIFFVSAWPVVLYMIQRNA